MSDVASPGSNDPERRPELRIGNSEREQVINWLQSALSEGRLEVVEYDERVAAVYAAKTQSDLDPITVDLPPPGRQTSPPPPAPDPAVPPRDERDRRGRPRRGSPWVPWATVVAVNMVIWAIVMVSTGGGVYPWWVWIAGPWGAILLANQIFGDRGRDR